MHHDLTATRAALLDSATSGAFLALLRSLIGEEGLDFHAVLVRRGPRPGFMVRVLGLAGDAIMVEHELPIDWGKIDERVRLGVLEAWAEQLLDQHERWRRTMNIKLVALGQRPIA